MIAKSKNISPLSFLVYFWTVFLLGLAGLTVSIYLSISHYRVYTDIGYRSFCAISKAINCDTVSQSPYSILLGLPVPVWGIVGYFLFLLLASMTASKAAKRQRLWALLIFISLVFCIYSIILALISTFIIHSYCIMCIICYAINFLLLYYTWLTRNRFKNERFLSGLKKDVIFCWIKRKITFPLLAASGLGVIALVTFTPAYWRLQSPPLTENIPMGVTQQGHPWIGAEHPKLVITEYTDYQCFQCKKMHYFIRQLIAQYPEKIRLVHRHFPMDQGFNPIVKAPFHVGSGEMALLAISAVDDDHFWQINDALFEMAGNHQNINIKELAQKVGMDYRHLVFGLKNRIIRNRLQQDIISGLKLNINGTPAFVIDGKVYFAKIPPEIIHDALKQ
jgi:protein-disulfide isomerase/uncharacterized membrane protein